MSLTIIDGFQKLRENLQITNLQESVVSTRHQNVREAVKQDLVVVDDFLTGSYKRSTMIAPLSKADVDTFCVLDGKYFEDYRYGGQATLLDRVKRILQRAYPYTLDISRDGQAVTIAFSDFKVDVVPAFRLQTGGYYIPNSIIKQWIATDPKKHITIWSEANKAHDGDLVPLIKMIKCWKREANVEIGSFHLESLLLQILTNVTITNFSSGARYVFDKARAAIKLPVPDPAGYNQNVGQYLSQSKLDDAAGKLETAYTRAMKAEQAAAKGNNQDAYYYWRLIFGDYFPAYG